MPSSPPSSPESTSLDALEALEDSIDNDPSLGAYRAQRLQELHADFARAQARNKARAQAQGQAGQGSGSGAYIEIRDEKGLMDIVTERKRCVVHFFQEGFRRCGIMNGHLETLASLHNPRTTFLRINVQNAPYLITKLHVRILPCVLIFVDALLTDRIIGFEALGSPRAATSSIKGALRNTDNDNDNDNFSTTTLESRLLAAGALEALSPYLHLRDDNTALHLGSTSHQRQRQDKDKKAKEEDEDGEDEWE